MNREEAIKKLKGMRYVYEEKEPNKSRNVALHMAIQALEQEPCNDDKPCTECPKYDKEKHHCPHFCHVIKGVFEDMEPCVCEDSISRQAVIEIIEKNEFKGDALYEIKQLPPVQPMRSVEGLIERISHIQTSNYGEERVRDWAVEITKKYFGLEESNE